MMTNNPFFKEKLIFNDESIFIEKGKYKEFVMDSCETSLMERTVELLVKDGDDLLEVGFGMGIFATFAQKKNLNSHTIVEGHPQVFEKLLKWSKDKNNVKILFGDWFDLLPEISKSKYDSVYFDTHNDIHIFDFFEKIKDTIKIGGKFSRFGLTLSDEKLNKREFTDTSIKVISNEVHPMTPSEHINYIKNKDFPICVIGL